MSTQALWAPIKLLITAACTNTGGKMKGSHPRAADRCPFVPRHNQVRLPLSCSWECYVLNFQNCIQIISFNVWVRYFQRVPLKFHTKYLTHTLKDVKFVKKWRFKSTHVYKLVNILKCPLDTDLHLQMSQHHYRPLADRVLTPKL